MILFLEFAAAVLSLGGKTAKAATGGSVLTGSVAEVGNSLYGKYLFPFEIASILLLSASWGPWCSHGGGRIRRAYAARYTFESSISR